MRDLTPALRGPLLGLMVNSLLGALKIAAGLLGNSYALVADGIESCADLVSGLLVWSGLRWSVKAPDEEHPYGHGKAEPLVALLAALALLASAALIAVQSIREIATPHHSPAPFTLAVLLLTVVVKESLFRFLSRLGREFDSTALRGDAWHHRSDALTSAAAFVGISLALLGGPGWEAADDWAALAACTVIAYNGVRLFSPAVDQMMDAAVPAPTLETIRAIAAGVPGVRRIEKCRARRSGLVIITDIHVWVDGEMSVRRSHEIAHQVQDRLRASPLGVSDVVVHIEPD